jgi:hypothetical protein
VEDFTMVRLSTVLITICAVAAFVIAASGPSLAFSTPQQISAPRPASAAVPVASLTAKAPDLIVILANPMNGKVVVRNVGSAASGPSDVTVECMAVAKAKSCAESRDMAPYENAAYPNKAWMAVPGLAPGAQWVHVLTFWGGLVWPSGTFKFVGEADAGHVIAETNEGNNTTSTSLVVP